MTIGGWTLGPLLGWLVLAGAVHERGRRRIRRRLGPGRVVGAAGSLAFWSGLVVLAVALVSPLDGLGEELFSAHMVQHLLIGLIAPLLLVAARPLRVMSWAVGPDARRPLLRGGHRVARTLRVDRATPATALTAVGLHVVVLAGWHLPVAYDAALATPPIHALEHASFFLSGLALWWVVVGTRWQSRSALAVVYLFLAALAAGSLAALLALAPKPLYDAHLATAAGHGLTPLEDQQLAGAIMWVPGGIVYLGSALVLFVRWLGSGPAPGQHGLRWEMRV